MASYIICRQYCSCWNWGDLTSENMRRFAEGIGMGPKVHRSLGSFDHRSSFPCKKRLEEHNHPAQPRSQTHTDSGHATSFARRSRGSVGSGILMSSFLNQDSIDFFLSPIRPKM